MSLSIFGSALFYVCAIDSFIRCTRLAQSSSLFGYNKFFLYLNINLDL